VLRNTKTGIPLPYSSNPFHKWFRQSLAVSTHSEVF
jgi:hypothetical protein